MKFKRNVPEYKCKSSELKEISGEVSCIGYPIYIQYEIMNQARDIRGPTPDGRHIGSQK